MIDIYVRIVHLPSILHPLLYNYIHSFNYIRPINHAMECIHREVPRAEDSKATCLSRSVSSLSCYLSSYPICSISSITFHRLSYKLSINHHHHIISCHIHLVEGLSSEKIKALKSNGITTGELASLCLCPLCYATLRYSMLMSSMLLYADILYATLC